MRFRWETFVKRVVYYNYFKILNANAYQDIKHFTN